MTNRLLNFYQVLCVVVSRPMVSDSKENLEAEVREWIEEILGEKLLEKPLPAALRSGVVLCKTVNKILEKGRGKDRADLKCPNMSQLEFFQMENIAYFIEKARELGVPDSENFQTIDLFEEKGMKQVYTCICSLSRNLYKNGRTDIRVIGPKLVEKVSITFTQEQLDEAKRATSRQYGSIRENKDD